MPSWWERTGMRERPATKSLPSPFLLLLLAHFVPLFFYFSFYPWKCRGLLEARLRPRLTLRFNKFTLPSDLNISSQFRAQSRGRCTFLFALWEAVWPRQEPCTRSSSDQSSRPSSAPSLCLTETLNLRRSLISKMEAGRQTFSLGWL